MHALQVRAVGSARSPAAETRRSSPTAPKLGVLCEAPTHPIVCAFCMHATLHERGWFRLCPFETGSGLAVLARSQHHACNMQRPVNGMAMPTPLHIDSSPLYGRSVSRELTAAFVTQWKASHPEGRVVDRDLNATAIPPVTAEWVGAVHTPENARTPQQRAILWLSDSLLAELEQGVSEDLGHEYYFRPYWFFTFAPAPWGCCRVPKRRHERRRGTHVRTPRASRRSQRH
jgi:hypothetical protein